MNRSVNLEVTRDNGVSIFSFGFREIGVIECIDLTLQQQT